MIPQQLELNYCRTEQYHDYALDLLIKFLCDKYNIPQDEVHKHHIKSTRDLTKLKSVCCYLNVLILQVPYQKLMEKLGWGVKTQSMHTKLRQKLLKKMSTDKELEIEVKSLRKEFETLYVNDSIALIEKFVKVTKLPIAVNVYYKKQCISVNNAY